MNSSQLVNNLNDKYFGGSLSPQFLLKLQQFPVERQDVHDFIERMFGFMKMSGMQAKDLSLLHADIMGTLLARILPGAWEGRIPPITVQGRHAIIDRYVKVNNWLDTDGKSMLDIGCGFPPFTTIESSEYLDDWDILGADPSLPDYLVYDAEGNYATFDENKSIVYFQPAIPSIENWNKLLEDSRATSAKFETLLDNLLKSPKMDGFPRLEINPIINFQTDKLSFVKGGIGQIDIESKDVIRCFNVLYYFDKNFQKQALQWFNENLNEGGIAIVGGDWAGSTECYYNVYKKVGNKLENKELAFSVDCISPFAIVTWFANYADDPQKLELMKIVGLIKSDKKFMDTFYKFHDAQHAKYNLCPRDEHGYYGEVDPTLSPLELWMRVKGMLDEMVEEGFPEMVVEVLVEAGYKARVNEVNHIAIEI